jgi:nicotinic acetylcholine receptor
LIKGAETGDVSNFKRNGEWILENLSVEKNVKKYTCCESPYPDITYYVLIRRRPLFYIFNMIIPCVVLTLVALLGFMVPAESSEKMSLSVTTLLSMTGIALKLDPNRLI